MKSIRCPHCQSICGLGVGYYHDEKLNIRCNRCHKVILATNEEDERELQKLYTRPVKETHDHTTHHTHSATWPPYVGRHHHHHDHRHGPGQSCPLADDSQDYD